MRRFKSTEKLQHDWASLAVLSRRFELARDPRERADAANEAMAVLGQLREEFGEEIRDAIAIVGAANAAVNTTRGQQIGQYHRNRIGKLERSIAAIDKAMTGEGGSDAFETIPDLQVAELTSQRQALEYELKDHCAKVDRRSHGVHLTQMRRKHR